jgi:D-3-phosphoglycerate dehydrogenase
MKTVLLPEPIRPEGRRILEGRVRIVEAPDRSPEMLTKYIRNVHGVVLRTGARITAEIIAEARHLQVIARTGAGVDNVDMKAATERGISVCSVPDANVVSVAEHVIALLLALSKQLKTLDEEVRRGNFAARYRYLSTELWEKSLGIIGLGKIGREVAEKARRGLGMKALAFDPYVTAREARGFGAEAYDSLTEMLAQSDAVTLHVPLTEETRGLIDTPQLTRMKKTAYLVNTSRAPVVDRAALLQALKTQEIAGAAIDVHDPAPCAPDDPLVLLDKVLATPWSAFNTEESVARMCITAARDIVAAVSGHRPQHPLNDPVNKHSAH